MQSRKHRGETLTEIPTLFCILWLGVALYASISMIFGDVRPMQNGLYDSEHVLEDEKSLSVNDQDKEKHQEKANEKKKKKKQGKTGKKNTPWIDWNNLFASPGDLSIEDFNDYHGGP